MPQRDSHAPGTFSWAELATSRPDSAKAFYSSLLGWDYRDEPVGDGQIYSMALRDDHEVAAIFASEQPPHWSCHVTVKSADATAQRAGELGGSVVAAPFDVLEAGRMAVIADPHGAALCLWEPRSAIGARLVNTPGAMTWNDLLTPDPAASAQFYEALFGWSTEEVGGPGGYRVITNGTRSNGGMMPIDPATMGAMPPNWMPYFGHEDVDRMALEVEGIGGRLLSGPLRMPQGSIAVMADPQGAVFALWTGAYED